MTWCEAFIVPGRKCPLSKQSQTSFNLRVRLDYLERTPFSSTFIFALTRSSLKATLGSLSGPSLSPRCASPPSLSAPCLSVLKLSPKGLSPPPNISTPDFILNPPSCLHPKMLPLLSSFDSPTTRKCSWPTLPPSDPPRSPSSPAKLCL